MTRTLSLMLALFCAAPAFAEPVTDFEQWLGRWQKAGTDYERSALMTEGARLVKARHDAMSKLIRLDPAAALQHAVERTQVPAELAADLEVSFDAPGTWEVLGFFGKDKRTGIQTWAAIGSQRFQTTAYGQLLGAKTGPMRLKGIALDGWAAVSDRGAARSKKDVGDPQPSPLTTGLKRLLYIRVDFSDAPGAPVSVTDAQNAINQLNTYYKASSYNKTSIVGTITNVLRMPQTKSAYANANNTSGLLADARAAAAASNPGTWELDCVIFTGIGAWGWAGLGYVGAKGVWLNGAPQWDVVAHEIGHNYGLYHANFWQSSGETIIGAGSSLEYGNPFEIMGGGQGQHNAWYKYDLDWFGPTEVDVITSSNSTRLYDLEQPITGGSHAAKVPISGARDYWVHFRPAAGGLGANGVEINWGYPTSDSSDLLDMTPWTASADDAQLVIGRTFSDFTAGIHITPVGLAATNPPSIDVAVNRGLFPGNHAPAVTLMASATQVTSGSPVTFTATATDADGDPMAYYWDFGDTSVSTNSSTQVRTFTGTRELVARVTVTDMRGGTGTAWIVVRVGAPTTKQISGSVREAGVGVEGVRVVSGGKTALTDSAGAYTLVGFTPGNFTVTAAKAGWTINTTFANPVTVGATNLTGIDFVGLRALYSISGHISSVGMPVAGATVTAGQYSTLTNANGDYTLTGVPNGGYVLNAIGPLGEVFVTQGFTNPIQINGSNQANRNFVENVFPVSGEVLGLAGPHSVSDGIRTVQTTLSGGHWVYTFPKVPPGSWSLFSYAAGQLITPNFTNPVVVTNAAVTLKTFTAVAGTGHYVRGHIDEAGAPLVGCVVTDGTNSVTTDSLGFYTLPNIADGTVTITPAKAGYQFSPNNRMVVVAGADSINNDFSVLNANAPPTIAFPPHATPSPVIGTTTQLTVLGDDPIEGELALKYQWKQTFGPAPATVPAAVTNGSKTVTVTFTKPGAYSFTVDIIDGGGLKVTGSVTLLVLQTSTTVTLAPAGTVAAPVSMEVDTDKQFVASVVDQFGGMVDFGGEAQWSVDTGGTITPTGKFSATAEGDSVVTATVNGKMGSSNVHVIVGPVPRIAMAPMATPNPTFDDTTALSVLGSDDKGESKLTYKWSVVNPTSLVTFSPNNSNAAKNSTAKFTALGQFNLKVEITDEDSLTTTGFLTVTVSSGAVQITVALGTQVAPGGKVTVTASGHDIAGGVVAPTGCVWSVDGGGTIDAVTGEFTAGSTPGKFHVTATCGGHSGTGEIEITGGGAGGGGGGGGGKGCGCSAGNSENALQWAVALVLFGLWLTRNPRSSREQSRDGLPQAVRGALLLTLLAGCTERTQDRSESYAGSPQSVGHSTAALGEPLGGYPSDQERMLHVLINQARVSPTTPNHNDCGDYTAEVGVKPNKTPLVWVKEANVGARFTSRHMSELGCYQHENCCELGDAGNGAVGCVAPAACGGANCNKVCDAGFGQGAADRYRMLGFPSLSSEGIGQGVTSAYDFWCSLMQSTSNRAAIYDDAGTQFGAGNWIASNQTCNGSYWTLAYGNAQTTVPKIPAASAIYNPPNPLNTSQFYFASNYFDPGKPPKRGVVVVAGHCFDVDKTWGNEDNGTYEARFPDPDVLPDGCHPYYFLFKDGDGNNVTYPTVGSFQVAVGATTSCPVPYDPAPQLPADCETGVQQCPAGGTQKCYTADNATLGKGECRQGNQVCRNGFWSACKDMISPFPEVCDGLDNNCNGTVDEAPDGGDLGGNGACSVFGERGICTAGVRKCIGGRVQCVGTTAPQIEVCNNIDDDCDGVVDDGFSIATCGVGECSRIAYECIGGAAGVCVPGAPTAEINDGRDNDCDGIVDNDFPCTPNLFRNVPAPTPRFVDGGVYPISLPCKGGVQQCQADAGWGPITGMIVPSREICDDIDNDCDGKADIQSINQIGWERCGTGECTVYTASCKAGGTKVTCTPTTVKAEVCNGLDDNCDGTIDEGCHCRTTDERGCYTGPSVTRDAGVCHGGKRTCAMGNYTQCTGQVVPSDEYCNGLDEDCDGLADNPQADGGLACIPLPSDGGTGGGAGGGSGGGAGGGSGGGSAGGGAGGGTGGGGGKSGCGCSGAPDGVLAFGLLGLLRARRKKQ